MGQKSRNIERKCRRERTRMEKSMEDRNKQDNRNKMEIGQREQNAKYMKKRKSVEMMKIREMDLEVGGEAENDDNGRRKVSKSV